MIVKRTAVKSRGAAHRSRLATMFYGSPTIHDDGDGSLQLQAAEITDQRVILRLRDTRFTSGPHATTSAAAAGSRWVLQDTSGHRYGFEQSSTGGGPFQGIVDIAFLIESGLGRDDELILESQERSIRFSLR
ncbi:hypothetical protein ACFVU2_00240 [Leifsonia sp. NPDC058194]|uniref:hypothetical protein n=1 Tax=Leifsonia sp. NPDC058194 TaxID=3346374 RepID=UPI0036DAD5CC